MKKPTWVIEKERARRAAAAETVWLFGLHAVRDALANPAREKLRLVLTKNAADRLGAKALSQGPAPEIVDPRKFDSHVPLDRESVHQGAALEVKPLHWGALEDVCATGAGQQRQRRGIARTCRRDHRARIRFAIASRRQDGRPVFRIREQLRFVRDRPSRGVGFEASDRAATAPRTVDRHTDMSEFNALPVAAFVHLSVNDYAATDTGSESEIHDIRVADGSAESRFTERRAVRVVRQARCATGQPGKFAGKGDVLPTNKVWRENDDASHGVQRSGRRHADRSIRGEIRRARNLNAEPSHVLDH